MRILNAISKENLRIIFQGKGDVSTAQGRAFERKRRIALTALTSLIGKVVTMALPVVTVKITYSYLGAEVYGLWGAVGTFFGLFAFSDLGLGNGLQTKLSQANGKDDLELCRKLISNTYAVLWFVAMVLFLIFISAFKFVNWASLMNATSEETMKYVGWAVFLIITPKIFSIPVAIIQRTQYALQEGYSSNIWKIVGAFLNLFAVIAIAKLDLGKMTLLATSACLPLFVSALNMVVYFRIQRPELKFSFRLFDFLMVKELLLLGVLFSVLSVLMHFGLSMDTFLVAKLFSLKEAGPYSILCRITAMFAGVVGLLSTALWGANGEAIARGDFEWVKNNTRRMSLIMGGLTGSMSLLLLLVSKLLFRIWLGPDFEFSYPALLWICVMQILYSFISPWFMVLNAYGMVKQQIAIFCIYTPLAFAMKYLFSQRLGIWSIAMIGSLLYLFIICIYTMLLSKRKLSRCEKC